MTTKQITFDGGKYEITINTETQELVSANWLKVHPNGNSVNVSHANLLAIALHELQTRKLVADKNETINVKNMTIAKLDEQVETLDKRIEELEERLKGKDETIDRLYKANENLAERKANFQQTINGLLEHNNRLKRELQAKRNDKPDTQSYTIIIY